MRIWRTIAICKVSVCGLKIFRNECESSSSVNYVGQHKSLLWTSMSNTTWQHFELPGNYEVILMQRKR